jgi:flagellar biosynthesis protein FlhF
MGMDILVERGASKGDCVQKITEKYGIWFTILRVKNISSSGFLGLFPREKVEVEFCLTPPRGLGRQVAPLQSVPLQGDALPNLPGMANSPLPGRQSATASVSSAALRNDSTLDFVEEKKRLLAAAGKDPERVLQQVQGQEEEENNQRIILEKVKEILAKIETGKEKKKEHPSMTRISQILTLNDFSERYTAQILERIRKELPLDSLEDFNTVQNSVVGWIGENIKIYETPERPERGRRRGKIMALVGPTGVGKTTTVAKLAASYSIAKPSGRHPLSVRVITIDTYRIGAMEQIEKYCFIMSVPVSSVDNYRDLHREIDLYRDEIDIILIDTIGRSPRDSVKLGEMKELLDACGSRAEIHLVLSASTKTSDMEHTLQQFEPFNYQAILLTKLDETRHIGNVISALSEKGKPISYITDGQSVPNDIKKASIVRLLINLDEFHIDREEIEKRFPAGEADQFQWG